MSFCGAERTVFARLEIVSQADIRGPEEAAAYLTKLRQILRYLCTLQSATCSRARCVRM